MKQSVILFAAALAFAACSQDSEDRSQDSNIIQLSAAISGGDGVKAGTRAAAADALQNTQFESGKVIHVEAYDHTTGNTYYQSTGNYTTGAGGAMTGSLYYPASGNNVDLKAFYPSTIASNSTEFEVNASQTTDNIANYQSSDLMYIKKSEASNLAKGNTIHPLTFYHAMSQIIVNITNGEGVEATDITSKVTAVKILNTVRQASLSIDTNGEITPSAKNVAASDITITGSGASNVGLIVPQEVAGGTNFISITYTGHTGDFVYALPAGEAKTFAKGTKYIYTFELSAAGIQLKSLTITDWAADPAAVEGNSGSGDFTI